MFMNERTSPQFSFTDSIFRSEFTPQLRSVWSDLQDTGRDLKVVVISLDRTEPDMMEFLEETKTYWPAVQFADDACGWVQTQIPR